MLFGKVFGQPKERPPRPPWVKWMLIGFAVYIFIQAITADPQGSPENNPMQKALTDAGKAIKEQEVINLSEYKKRIFPERNAVMMVKDRQAGKGPLAICGHKVAIAYTSFRATSTSPLENTATKSKPFVFRIGEGKAMPAFEEGLIGMRVGGKRSLYAPHSMSYGAKGFIRKDVASNEEIRFEVELLSVSPTIPDVETAPFRVAEVQPGYGETRMMCGQKVRVGLTIWDVTGKPLFSTYPKPSGKEASKTPAPTAGKATKPSATDGGITFTPGKSEVFLGLEQGVIGMFKGGIRTLIIPPGFQKTMNGNAPAIDFPLPDNQTVLVDVEYLP